MALNARVMAGPKSWGTCRPTVSFYHARLYTVHRILTLASPGSGIRLPFSMSDLNSALTSAIVAHPVDETRWLALAVLLWDNGRDDEAAAVRVFWPVLQDSLA